MPSTRGRPTGTRRQKRATQKANMVSVHNAVTSYHAQANRYVANSAARSRANTRAGLKGGLVGAAVGSVVAPGLGTAAGAIYGIQAGQQRNAARQFAHSAAGKKALARVNAANAKHYSSTKKGSKSITASHKGRAGNSPSKTASKPGGPKKKTNYKRGEHGRFAGSQ